MVAEVIVDLSVNDTDKIFDYSIPDDLTISAGDRVSVSFGSRQLEGFVVGIKPTSEYGELKPINRKLDDFTAVLPEMLDLMSFMQKKYNLRKADILRLFIPAQLRGGKIKEKFQTAVRIKNGLDSDEILAQIKPNAVAQRAAIAKLSSVEWEWISALREEFGGAVNALVQKGFVESFEISVARRPYKSMVVHHEKVTLSDEQRQAVDAVTNDKENKFLLFGVTGSGKTEVYLECIERVLEQGKTAIMLVPEISLTPQTMNRFRARFGDTVALLHSGLSAGERFDEWLRLLRGQAKIAVGARSAIYAPIQNVGIIIIDEEHDGSYTSDSNPRYNTSVIAEYRAKYNNAKLLKGSATPSIESFYETQKGDAKLLTMANRVNKRVMPEMKIVDMCQEIKRGNRTIFSEQFMKGLQTALDNGQQAMVFLNRRGYSSFMMCRKCGTVLKCENCDVSLTYHREDSRLKCHYCGAQYTVPSVCPKCGSESIRYGRDGTEKIVSDLKKAFPKARFLRMDNDTTHGKSSHLEILTSFRNGEADVLVGTQMIAKGHDFPKVTFVGILDADMSLYIGDYMSIERTFQLVTQVAGRAGRDELSGNVVLQSYSPNHYVFYFASKYDYLGFYRKEINVREVTNFPPFTKIVRILFSSVDEDKVFAATKAAMEKIKEIWREYETQFVSLKAMKSPLKKLENKYRYQIMIKIKPRLQDEIMERIYDAMAQNPIKDVSIFVEQDPQNLN